MSRFSMASQPYCRNCMSTKFQGTRCSVCGHDTKYDYVNIDSLADDDVIVEMLVGYISYDEFLAHQSFFKGVPYDSSIHVIRFIGQNERTLLPPSYYGKTVLKAGKQYDVIIEKKENGKITHTNKGILEIHKGDHEIKIKLEEDLYVEKKLFSQKFKRTIKIREITRS